MSVKIENDKLDKFNFLTDEEKKSYFGEWLSDVSTKEKLKKLYVESDPFPYVIIENFLNINLANEISELFPEDINEYHHYNNPIEVKYTYDNISKLDPKLQSVFYILSTDYISKYFSDITNIKLEVDPYLNGAGLHKMPRNGRLGIHLDYEKHPILNKQRRLNIILYLNKEWKEEWNGDSELWNEDYSECKVRSYPVFNRAIIFRTDEISWHGVSEKILCPEGMYRQSIAYYYLSDLEHKSSSSKIGIDHCCLLNLL